LVNTIFTPLKVGCQDQLGVPDEVEWPPEIKRVTQIASIINPNVRRNHAARFFMYEWLLFGL